MASFRARLLVTALALSASGAQLAPAGTVAAEPEGQVVAYLDGRSIPISEIPRYYCDDFSYPVIQCSKLALTTELRATVITLLTSVDYVTVWDGATFSGPSMNISQDYPQLMTIGWNDRVSSFKARNGQSGAFHTDWFSGGSTWSFCCNVQQSTLNAYSNTFSSIERT